MVSGSTLWRWFGHPRARYYAILVAVAEIIDIGYREYSCFGVLGQSRMSRKYSKYCSFLSCEDFHATAKALILRARDNARHRASRTVEIRWFWHLEHAITASWRQLLKSSILGTEV